ncbi:MAG TPA: flagellin [Candidatus Limnocylindrales bacterium]
MAITINTNLNALRVMRNLGVTSSAFSRCVESLSSGLRINRAADDAAGLAISERMQSQVTGLNQAQRNAQDGVSMVQTAGGALTEITSMIQRVRELSVEAANATIGSSDAASISIEVSALHDEINRLATTTKFNGISLLTGSSAGTPLAGGTLTIGKSLNTGHNAVIAAIDVSGAMASSTYTLSNSAGPDQLTMTRGSASQTVTLSAIGLTGTETIDFSQLGVSISVVGDVAKTATELATDLSGAAGAPTPGQPATIGFNGMAAQGVGTVAQGGTLTAGTAIDSAANGLLTSTTPTSSISGLSNLGAGLDGVVTTFTNGMLPDGSYTLAVTNEGHASTVGDANTTASITGSTAIDDTVNGLWTTTVGGRSINATTGPLTAAVLNAVGFGTSGYVDPANSSAGSVSGDLWTLEVADVGADVSSAIFRLRDNGASHANIILTNTGGVLTDSTSGFKLDLSHITGPVSGPGLIMLSFHDDVGVDVVNNNHFTVADAAGTQSLVNLTAGETFQQVADNINHLAVIGNAQVHATVGSHGLIITNAGVSANSNVPIEVTGQFNVVFGLGLTAPFGISTSGSDNPMDAIGIVDSADGSAGSFSGTLTNNVTHGTYNLTNTNNVLTDNNALGFRLDLSAVTGGALQTGLAIITSGVSSSTRTLRLTDENAAAQTFTLSAGETFQTLIDAINTSGLAIFAAMGSNGLGLINTGTDLNGTISAQGSDDVLRGLGLEASDGNAASTSNSTTITGSAGTATSGGGDGETIITGVGAGSGLMVFQVGANAGDTLSVNFGNATTSTFAGFDTAVTNLANATADAGHWASGQQSSTSALITASDAAIDTLNGLASSLGAAQNRLTHTISAVGVASENLEASRSRIRDLDVAAEMVKFTKTQILQQAGIAILSQANSSPQNILTLLR